ncbi:integral membrane protein [Nonlabens ulvanivorans]|nr:integral membrane protein [Nonlabens ulvanivorans]
MRQPTRSFSDKFYLVLKGIAMGTANKVPGVSGGVVAYVAGFYEEFIYSFQKLNLKALKLLFNGRFKTFYEYVNGRFLSLLILGEVLSYFTVSKGFDVLIKNYPPILVWSAFFGMILGSVYYISRDYDAWTRKNIMILAIGTTIGVGTSLLDPATDNTNLFFVFFCGMVSISGMTLPA